MKFFTLFMILCCIFVIAEPKKKKSSSKAALNEKQSENIEEVSPPSKKSKKDKKKGKKIKQKKKPKQNDQTLDEDQNYEYMTIEDLDPESLNLSYYADKYVLSRIFFFGSVGNFFVWILCCFFCNPCCQVLFNIWLLAAIFDYSPVLGVICLALCCGGQKSINSATENLTFSGIRSRRNQVNQFG